MDVNEKKFHLLFQKDWFFIIKKINDWINKFVNLMKNNFNDFEASEIYHYLADFKQVYFEDFKVQFDSVKSYNKGQQVSAERDQYYQLFKSFYEIFNAFKDLNFQ